MRPYVITLLALLVIVLPMGCEGNGQATEEMERAEAMMDDHPDSALVLLYNLIERKPALTERQQMRYDLLWASAQNLSYVPFTTDSVMAEVVRYFDRHGTATERMRAHYLLGCAHRDMGDAPMALKCFNTAVEAADTTRSDCDLATLSRIHSQMAGLYEQVAAYDLQQREDRLAETIAWQAADTVSALYLMWTRASAMYGRGYRTEAIAIVDSMAVLQRAYGIEECADCVFPMKIDDRLEQGDVTGAGRLLQAYDARIAEAPHILSDATVRSEYCYHKGRYHLLMYEADSAIVMFRRQLAGTVAGHRLHTLAYKGLKDAYAAQHASDSAVKYADLYCQANDSAAKSRTAESLIRMQALYNYTKVQEQAVRAERLAVRWRIGLLLGVFAAVVAGGVWGAVYRSRRRKWREELTRQNADYHRLMQELERTTTEQHLLRSDMQRYMQDKEEEIAALHSALQLYRADAQDVMRWNDERGILQCDTATHLHSLSVHGKQATPAEIESLFSIAQRVFPSFCETIEPLSAREQAMCVLIRFRFISSEVAVLLGLTPQRTTNMKSAINQKLFGVKGAKTLDAKLMAIVEHDNLEDEYQTKDNQSQQDEE